MQSGNRGLCLLALPPVATLAEPPWPGLRTSHFVAVRKRELCWAFASFVDN